MSRRSSRFIRFARRLADWLRLTTLFLMIALAAAYFLEVGSKTHRGPFKVLDGDSLETASAERLRLRGIDAPEYRQICDRVDGDWDCGRASARKLRALVENAGVACNGVEVDRFDRLLVTCLNDGENINAQMVLSGYALSYGAYEREERIARNEKRGLWGGTFEMPRAFRDRQRLERGDTAADEEALSALSSIAAWFRYWFKELISHFQ